eukprot:Seg22252.1 transcript_id=Seg22252.1/GoldUCD/mRNA.D3Y31 product="hypothetical protein" protein_id=Seg22252.1/GoldUCD/D3Y31
MGEWCTDIDEVRERVRGNEQAFLLKAPYSSAGRGHKKTSSDEWDEASERWVEKVIQSQGGVVLEPWLERVLDFSAQYEVSTDGEVKLFGMTRVINDDTGRYLGTFVHSKWTTGLDKELNEFLFREAKVLDLYKNVISAKLKELLKGSDFNGNLSIDAMVYRNEEGVLNLRKVVEINARITMGRAALELLKKTVAGKSGILKVVRKREISDLEKWLLSTGQNTNRCSDNLISEGVYPLNDPLNAKEFIALWTVS